MSFIQTLNIYFLVGLCEIGGGYLMWQWLKADRPDWMGLLGAVLLVAYGWMATWQATSFGKTYAVYGGGIRGHVHCLGLVLRWLQARPTGPHRWGRLLWVLVLVGVASYFVDW